ncbi:MAG TPA: phosphoribosylformylglycinamidine synthase subunit PurQ [Vicinamibacteria bacterium]|nr:phosphoribosylformylglycinamidine synthase subunit PurQ [Vicinamibacteria bacterium]
MPRFAVLVFPGSNCEEDVQYCLQDVLGHPTDLVWHKQTRLDGYDAVILPGGFAHGDYLRPGAIARFSPVMPAVASMAESGRAVVGICNGFQMLQEAGLLPGAMLRNRSLTYVCRYVGLRVEKAGSPLTETLREGDELRIPVGHADGNFFADERSLEALEKKDLVVFRYLDNPNGAAHDIAGIRNERGNVLGLMPHPDRCYEPALGTADGRKLFESLVAWTEQR